MTLQEALDLDGVQSSLARDCAAFAPELILCGTIILLLVLRLFKAFDRWHLGYVTMAMTAVALFVCFREWTGAGYSPDKFFRESGSTDLFGGLLVYDYTTVFLRMFLIGFAFFIVVLSMLTGIPDREDSSDYFTLILGATIGMSLMASTNHLMMMFIGVEMASLPSYALAGFLKGRRASSEAALKYVVYGGGAAGIMLYGISLLAGKFGTAYLPELATAYVGAFTQTQQPGVDPVLILGTLFVLIGLAFKLAAVPFHFWCPDVFEGAAAEVAGFLSVASKAAALALFGRFAFAFAGLGTIGAPEEGSAKVAEYLVPILAVFAIATATFGNLAAFYQTNLKRLLAYSTIAHAGYMMMGVATLHRDGFQAVLFYLVAYFLMNLGAFALVAFLRNTTGSEDLGSFRGLVRRSPWLVILLSVFLLSLLGVPPLAGFVAKFRIFGSLIDVAGQSSSPSVSTWLYVMLAFGLLNSVISAVYYIKVMKVMILDTALEDIEGREPEPLPEPRASVGYGLFLAGLVLVVGVLWGPIERATRKGVETVGPVFDNTPAKVAAGAKGGTP